jgi:hypothetical protein
VYSTRLIVWLGGILVLASAMLGIRVQARHAHPQAIIITEPDGINDTLSEIDEFATYVMGDAWDMNEASDTALYRPYDSAFSRVEYVNGHFSATLQYGDGRERIALLYAGALNNDAMRIGKIGYTYPINADKYRYLSYRLYTNVSGYYSGLIKWHASDDRTNSADMGVSNAIAPVPADGAPGWHIYAVDLQTIGIQQGQKDWNGTIRELQLIPIGGSGLAGKQIKLDWVRLTVEDPRTSRPYTIHWSGGASGTIDLYASPDDQILDSQDILIVRGVNATDGSYVWQTGVLPSGKYYIYLTNGSESTWSPAPLIINPPPILTITRPSMTSGEEYAATVIGNPWDMSDSDDLNLNPPSPLQTWLDQPRFEDGIFHARTLCCPTDLPYSDPIFFLGGMNPNPPGTPDPEVDTSKYHYLSFRFYQEGEQDILNGWVARFYWWKTGVQDVYTDEAPTEGRAILLYEGWNTYKLDLWASDARDAGSTNLVWQEAHPNRLRLDPNELLPEFSPGYVHLDWIKLTATDEVIQGNLFPIQYLSSESGATANVYYDTDTDSTNGRIPIQLPAPVPAPSPTLTNTVYLPLVVNNLVSDSQIVVMWDTTGVAPGTYWISIDADDGYNTTTWYSEAPINVLPSTSARSLEWKRKYLLNLP